MRLMSQLIILLLASLARPSFAEQLVVPIVESEGKIYLGAEFTRVDQSSLGDTFTSATEVGEQFLKLIKGTSRTDSTLFSSRDGSDAKWLDPVEYSRYAGFKKIDKISYDKKPIVWGSYLHIPTNYKIGERGLPWREDYLCSSGQCKKSLYEFGQLFEVAYKYYVKGTNGEKQGEVSSMLSSGGNTEVFDMASTLPSDQSGPAFKVGINIAKIESNNCVLCDSPEYGNSFDKALLSNVREFVNTIQDVDVFNEEQITALLKKYDSTFVADLGIPKVKWDAGPPQLVHTDSVGYIREWQRFSEGQIEGYMLDDDFAYLFTTRIVTPEEITGLQDGEDTTSQTTQAYKQFQIFALKKNSTGAYELFPHTNKELESRALVFDSSTLALFSQMIGV